jgi:hypothetical protein
MATIILTAAPQNRRQDHAANPNLFPIDQLAFSVFKDPYLISNRTNRVISLDFTNAFFQRTVK